MPRVSKDVESSKNDIMQACLSLFNEKGLKFTMDDIAIECHMSKKTLYRIFDDKEELFLAMVDYLFDGIKESERQVLENPQLTTIEKIRRILGVMPESYSEIDFRQLYLLKDKFPTIYSKVESRLETGWDGTLSLLQKGQEEGTIRADISLSLVKLMLESAVEQFFKRDVLIKNSLTYTDSLNQVVGIIVDGIVSK